MEVFRFGKYKGLTYDEARKKSPSYFTWLWFNIKEKLDKPLLCGEANCLKFYEIYCTC